MLSFHQSGQLERIAKRNTLMLLRYIFIFLGLFLSNELDAQNQCGIDVSRHQGRIEWQKVPIRDISFVYIKATEGATYIDPCFHYNIKGAAEAGFKVGAYHYFRMLTASRALFWRTNPCALMR